MFLSNMRSLYTLLCVAKSLGGVQVIKGIKAIRICITKCIPMDRWGLFITQVYALKSGAWLCGQKFTQDFSFKIHLFLQNVLH